jgi:hypothetical protein
MRIRFAPTPFSTAFVRSDRMPAAATSHRLICHPATPCRVVSAIEVTLARRGGGLALGYALHAEGGRLRLPAASTPAAADGLWQHSCCEIFVAAAGDPAYREFNLSPSGQWAAYAFRACRERDVEAGAQLLSGFAPDITARQSADRFELTAQLPPFVLPSGALEIGLAVVVEGSDGELSYWALRHPAPRPDFHDRGGFALRLDPALESTA